jgi:hypothetical protein
MTRSKARGVLAGAVAACWCGAFFARAYAEARTHNYVQHDQGELPAVTDAFLKAAPFVQWVPPLTLVAGVTLIWKKRQDGALFAGLVSAGWFFGLAWFQFATVVSELCFVLL